MNDKPAETAFAYDEVTYPTPVISRQTPDQMGSALLVHGYTPPPAETASVLEIGCGNGYNLIGAAASMPKGRYVGFDLARKAVADGQDLVRQAGLTNVTIEYGDILTWPRDGEKFDYISCHGVYTWVPPHVRDATMELIGKVLAPGGVAYIGYDCLPAAASKAAINRFLVNEVGHIADPVDRVDTAVTVVNVLARHQLDGSRLKTQLDSLVKDAPTYPRGYFFHDWLAEFYNPVSIGDFAADASANGLSFVGDIAFHDLYEGHLDGDARAILAKSSGNPAQRNIVLDILRGSHMFRGDILMPSAAPAPREPQPLRKLTYSFGGLRELLAEEEGRPVRYKRDTTFITAHEKSQQKLMDALIEAYPLEPSYAQLREETGLDEATLDRELHKVVVMGLIDVHITQPGFTLSPGERPRAGQLVRAMIQHSDNAITLRHGKFQSNQAPTRLMIYLCDGSRTRAEIAAEMSAQFGQEVSVERVDSAIAEFAPNALFEA